MKREYDVIIVGGGPAGLTAALYLGRAKYRVLVLEKDSFGGQIAITQEVVNYPGIEKIDGRTLGDTMRRQAEAFGAEFLSAEAQGFDLSGHRKTVRTDRGDFQCFGLLIATGAHPRPVGFRGEETYKGRGVAYCATCDGEFFTGKEIFVVGGGYAAAEESVFLTKFASHVTVLIRKGDFSCAASVAERAKNHEKITVLTHTVLEEVAGEEGLTYARYKNTATGEVTEYRNPEGFGVFVLAGYAPATEALKGHLELDEQGYVITDRRQKTSVEGVYAAGDVCIKPLRQVVTATGDGALAATELEKYVAAVHEKIGFRPEAASKPAEPATEPSDELFSAEDRQQLAPVFSAMEQPLVLKLELDQREISAQLEQFATALAEQTDRLSLAVERQGSEDSPCVRICRADGQETGLAFHGIPGGHEFTSFVLGLYNAAGPGQKLDSDTLRRIRAIAHPTKILVLVTLSCGMCPDLVVAAQHIAAINPLVTAHVYDVRHFEALRRKYQVMSVPCLVINDTQVSFGKKNIHQLLDLLGV